MSESQHLADTLVRVHEPEIDASGLERNQQAETGGVNRIHSPEIKNDRPPVLPAGNAQEGSFIATHDSASTVQNHNFVQIFDGYMQHFQSPENRSRIRQAVKASSALVDQL